VRAEIFEALRDGFGGESHLFASLWRSPSAHDPIHQESFVECVTDITGAKVEAFGWISEGMEELH
jgi:hypothetical protein